MRNVSYIEKKELLKLYEDKIVAASSNGTPKDITWYPSEEVRLRILRSIGPYHIAVVHNLKGQYELILPKAMVQTRSVGTALEEFTPTLDRYHKGNWTTINSFVYINYPELQITNSLKGKHTLTNMLVRFAVGPTGTINGLTGCRGTLSVAEMKVGYIHSHLPRQLGSRNFTDFCLGNADAGSFGAMYYELASKENSVFEFDVFLMQLRAYLEWESLEGSPYISLANVKTGSTSQVKHTTDYSVRGDEQISLTHLLLQTIIELEAYELIDFDLDIPLIIPSRNEELMFKVEQAMVANPNLTTLARSGRVLRSYDTNSGCYLGGNGGTDHNDPGLDVQTAIDALKIKPVVVDEPDAPDPAGIIRRFETQTLLHSVVYANKILQHGYREIE